MFTILDNIDTIDESDSHITYIDSEGTLVIESYDECPLLELEEQTTTYDSYDTENPELIAFRSLLFDTVYHQLDIREWVL